MIKVAIFAHSEESYLESKRRHVENGFKPEIFDFVCSKFETRLQYLQRSSGDFVIFLDYDCTLTIEVLNKLSGLSSTLGLATIVYQGLYTDARGASLLQRAHNIIANIWVNESTDRSGNCACFLGGAFAINVVPNTLDELKMPLFWGGEDKYLADLLRSKSYEIVSMPGFTVEHQTSPSLYHFFKRAYLQGRSEAKYLKNDSHKSIRIMAWLRKIASLKLALILLILLHLCIQTTVRTIHKVLRMRT